MLMMFRMIIIPKGFYSERLLFWKAIIQEGHSTFQNNDIFELRLSE